ncbi:hypothetical protein D3C84_951100 [compost metagenome]
MLFLGIAAYGYLRGNDAEFQGFRAGKGSHVCNVLCQRHGAGDLGDKHSRDETGVSPHRFGARLCFERICSRHHADDVLSWGSSDALG